MWELYGSVPLPPFPLIIACAFSRLKSDFYATFNLAHIQCDHIACQKHCKRTWHLFDAHNHRWATSPQMQTLIIKPWHTSSMAITKFVVVNLIRYSNEWKRQCISGCNSPHCSRIEENSIQYHAHFVRVYELPEEKRKKIKLVSFVLP